MSGEETAKPVIVDPQCIKEALRTFLPPIKTDDPQVDFYNMYKREMMEYDAEYMKKYNEDLNTTLIFAGLFSAVSSAFIIDIQRKLEPDPNDRSEAYLRAILLSLNRSITPSDIPAAPPVWNSPPTEIITTSSLLYASLLISLLAAFVAMLGKQWVGRYLRHTGGSMFERCGDRQRKFDGLERWRFRVFIDGLPIMLQAALLLLTSALSRYMWSVNTSVARVVISFTVLGVLFYTGIVAAGTSSYECPFQTPTSITLRRLGKSKTARKLLLAPFLLVRAILSGEVSLSEIIPVIQNAAREVKNRTSRLLRRIGRAFGDALGQVVRMAKLTQTLPRTAEGAHAQPGKFQNGPGLRVDVRNLKSIRRQNMDNPRCVSWVLRNITDPEAIDAAIRLAGAIRWFNGDSDYSQLFDLISSTLKECFDSTKQPYPGMRDRAYFSTQAILQIQMKERAQSDEHAFEFPIPTITSSIFQHTDPDLHHLIHMFECNSYPGKPTLNFPKETNSRAHSLWMSNLFVDVTQAGSKPILASWQSYLSAAIANHQAMIANTLLLWYAFLGGHIEEGTILAVDKSGSLENILSHLSQRVMEVITDGKCLQHLDFLLEFLAAWEERPTSLARMAYQWCATISKAAGKLGLSGGEGTRRLQLRELTSDERLSKLVEEAFSKVGLMRLDATFRPQDPTPNSYVDLLHTTLEIGFRRVAFSPDGPPLRLDHTPHHEWAFETAFSNNDDEVLADALSVWILGDRPPPGSCARYLAKRVKMVASFSPRLRQVAVHVIERIWRSELELSGPETVSLLNRLNVGMDDTGGKCEWAELLVDAIRSPTGLKVSSHYWHLLDELALATDFRTTFVSADVEIMRSLRKIEDWNRLEIWTVVVWRSQTFGTQMSKAVEGAEQETLNLLLGQPSAIPRFEALRLRGEVRFYDVKLQQICDQAQANTLSPEPPTPQPQTTNT